MPYTIQKTTLIDGPRTAVIHVVITSDGSGELVNAPFIDSRNDMYPKETPTRSTITQIWWGTSYFDTTFLRQDTVPVPLWVLNVGTEAHVDFRSVGGLAIPVDMDGTGDILITTSGFAPAGSVGTYILELKKD